MTQYRLATLAVWALSGCLVCAQPAVPQFEVGTVKVSEPGSGGPFSVIPVYPGVRNGTFEARHMPLKRLLAYAHDVSEVQIAGPDWLDKNYYNVMAKVPEGTQPSQARGMLREFLAERFRVVTHSSVREMDALALVVDGKGHKLHLVQPGESYRRNIPKGGGSLISSESDMRGWADLLTRVVGSPVIDQTGLQGRYAGAVMYTAYDRLGDGSSEFPAFPVALKEHVNGQ